MSDPVHPTYGTLEAFFGELAKDIKEGWYIRIGQMGALNWFSDEYAKARPDGGFVDDSLGSPPPPEGATAP